MSITSRNQENPALFANENRVPLWTFGVGARGKLGHGEETNKLAPMRVESLRDKDIVLSSAGTYHSAAVSANGEVYTWGEGIYGQLGHGDRDISRVPRECIFFRRMNIVKDISCGGVHTIVMLDNHDVYTWGEGLYGKLGHGDDKDCLIPKRVEALDNKMINAVSAGYRHCAALSVHGEVYTWGDGSSGRLGHGSESDCVVPTKIQAIVGKYVSKVSCGGSHTLAIINDQVWSWGDGGDGRLGHGDTKNRWAPTRITQVPQVMFNEVSAGDRHSACVSKLGQLFTWGRGYGGRLGLNDFSDKLAPMVVKNLSKHVVRSISMGHSHSACITEKGVLFTWGEGNGGRLGLEDDADRGEPEDVASLGETVARKVSCGGEHTLLVTDRIAVHYIPGSTLSTTKPKSQLDAGPTLAEQLTGDQPQKIGDDTMKRFKNREQYYYQLLSKTQPLSNSTIGQAMKAVGGPPQAGMLSSMAPYKNDVFSEYAPPIRGAPRMKHTSKTAVRTGAGQTPLPDDPTIAAVKELRLRAEEEKAMHAGQAIARENNDWGGIREVGKGIRTNKTQGPSRSKTPSGRSSVPGLDMSRVRRGGGSRTDRPRTSLGGSHRGPGGRSSSARGSITARGSQQSVGYSSSGGPKATHFSYPGCTFGAAERFARNREVPDSPGPAYGLDSTLGRKTTKFTQAPRFDKPQTKKEADPPSPGPAEYQDNCVYFNDEVPDSGKGITMAKRFELSPPPPPPPPPEEGEDEDEEYKRLVRENNRWAVIDQKRRTANPGPGKYRAPSAFDKYEVKNDREIFQNGSKMAQELRGMPVSSAPGPGPGKYDTRSESVLKQNYFHGKSTFTGSQRTKARGSDVPGPTYDVDVELSHMRHPPAFSFGAERVVDQARGATGMSPGPDEYSTIHPGGASSPAAHMGTGTRGAVYRAYAGPGFYVPPDDTPGPEYDTSFKECLNPRAPAAVMSQAMRDWAVEGTWQPGVGAYDPDDSILQAKKPEARMVGKNWPPNMADKVPGPGAYDDFQKVPRAQPPDTFGPRYKDPKSKKQVPAPNHYKPNYEGRFTRQSYVPPAFTIGRKLKDPLADDPSPGPAKYTQCTKQDACKRVRGRHFSTFGKQRRFKANDGLTPRIADVAPFDE